MPNPTSSKLDVYLGQDVTVPANIMEDKRIATGKLGKLPSGPNKDTYYVLEPGKEAGRPFTVPITVAELDTLADTLASKGGRRKSRRVKKRHVSRRAKHRTRRSKS